MRPSFTIIVPVYNVSSRLRTGLDSLLAQTERDWTAVCVDDGSTDGSGAILDEYAGRDRRIEVVHRPHCGVSVARNAGLDLARGELVAFMDPDDAVASDWLERLAAGLRGADAVLSGYAENGRQFVPRDAGAVYAGGQIRARCWRAFFGYRLRDVAKLVLPGGIWNCCGREMAGVWRLAVKRSALGDLRFDPRLRLYEDAMFLSALAVRLGSLSVAGDCGYDWRVDSDGAMTRERRERLLDNKFAVRDVRRELDPGMSAWRGTFLLSALEVLRAAKSLRACLRYLAFKPCSASEPVLQLPVFFL